MRRREFIRLFVSTAAAWPLAARGQPSVRSAKLGFLFSRSLAALRGLQGPFFFNALRELGWVEGQNIQFELRAAEDRAERLPDLAEELVRLNVDVIVVNATLATRAAKQATSTIPIVMLAPGDPVGDGLIDSLARPGANVTGMSALLSPELGAKRLQLLKELLPALSKVAVLWDPGPPASMRVLKETQEAAQVMQVAIDSVEVRGSSDFGGAFEGIVKSGVDAMITIGDPLTLGHRKIITDFATRHRVPCIYGFRVFVDAGGLMAYGPDLSDLWRRGAGHVDKILKGAKPADLPVEQPNKYELVINLKPAKALGLTVPPSLLARADEVIE